jgi:hypothetical protein
MSMVKGVAAPAAAQDVPVRARVLVTGAVPLPVQAEASRAVAAAFEAAGVHGADVRIRLTWDPDDRPRPAVAQINADVDGRAMRAQVSAADLGAVVEAIVERLVAQLAGLTHDWTPRVGPQEERGWPSRSARPSGERELVRVKSFSLARLTAHEAVRHMDAMDYNFYLYASAETGEGCLVYRIGPTGYRVSTPSVRLGPPAGLTPPLTWQPQAPFRFTEVEALEHLGRTDYPFVSFYEGDVARVMYRRYDGHYGLISGRAQ